MASKDATYWRLSSRQLIDRVIAEIERHKCGVAGAGNNKLLSECFNATKRDPNSSFELLECAIEYIKYCRDYTPTVMEIHNMYQHLHSIDMYNEAIGIIRRYETDLYVINGSHMPEYSKLLYVMYMRDLPINYFMLINEYIAFASDDNLLLVVSHLINDEYELGLAYVMCEKYYDKTVTRTPNSIIYMLMLCLHYDIVDQYSSLLISLNEHMLGYLSNYILNGDENSKALFKALKRYQKIPSGMGPLPKYCLKYINTFNAILYAPDCTGYFAAKTDFEKLINV